MLNRRTFVAGLGGVFTARGVARAQMARTPTIGLLTLSVGPSEPMIEAFRQGLREHGYAEGQTIALEYRFAQGRPEKLRGMAIELVRMNVSAIVTESVLAAGEAKRATDTMTWEPFGIPQPAA